MAIPAEPAIAHPSPATLGACVSPSSITRSLLGDALAWATAATAATGLLAWGPAPWLLVPLLLGCALAAVWRGATALQTLRLALRSNPVLAIHRDGVTFAAGGVTGGGRSHTLAWSAIRQVRCASSADPQARFAITCSEPGASAGAQAQTFTVSARHLTQTPDAIWSAFKTHLPAERLDANLLRYNTPIRHLQSAPQAPSTSSYSLNAAADRVWEKVWDNDNDSDSDAPDSSPALESVESDGGGDYASDGASSTW